MMTSKSRKLNKQRQKWTLQQLSVKFLVYLLSQLRASQHQHRKHYNIWCPCLFSTVVYRLNKDFKQIFYKYHNNIIFC